MFEQSLLDQQTTLQLDFYSQLFSFHCSFCQLFCAILLTLLENVLEWLFDYLILCKHMLLQLVVFKDLTFSWFLCSHYHCFRRAQPTVEFVFAATEEAIFVHVVISARLVLNAHDFLLYCWSSLLNICTDDPYFKKYILQGTCGTFVVMT
jgi:hypothetical protein